jgi:hypothetical protein
MLELFHTWLPLVSDEREMGTVLEKLMVAYIITKFPVFKMGP